MIPVANGLVKSLFVLFVEHGTHLFCAFRWFIQIPTVLSISRICWFSQITQQNAVYAIISLSIIR